MTLVVLGDSFATTSLLPTYQQALRATEFPRLLGRSLGCGDARVRNLALPGRHIASTLRRIDEIVQLEPSIVVICHGGLEALIRLPRPFNRLSATIGGAPDRRRHVRLADLLRRPIWWLLSPALCNAPAWCEAVLSKLGIRPIMSSERFARGLQTLVDALTARTSADVILIVPSLGSPRVAPWSRSALLRNQLAAESTAAGNARCRHISLEQVLSWPEHFSKDGVHLSAAGHAAVALAIEAALPRLRESY